MTREEAIAELREDKALYESDICHAGDGTPDGRLLQAIDMAIEALSADAEPKMTEEVREALMRLTMCAREECAMCKYKDKCGFEFQYNISTENMNTLLDALSADVVQGEWIGYNADKEDWLRTDGTPIFLVCDKCHGTVINNGSAHWNFCPNCGARMTPYKGGDYK